MRGRRAVQRCVKRLSPNSIISILLNTWPDFIRLQLNLNQLKHKTQNFGITACDREKRSRGKPTLSNTKKTLHIMRRAFCLRSKPRRSVSFCNVTSVGYRERAPCNHVTAECPAGFRAAQRPSCPSIKRSSCVGSNCRQ